jgi:hypothetical protein
MRCDTRLLATILALGGLLGAPVLVRGQSMPERLYECRRMAGPEEYGRGFGAWGRPSLDGFGRVAFVGMRDDFTTDLARCCDDGNQLQVFERHGACPEQPGVELSGLADAEANALGQVLYRASGCDTESLFLSQNDPALPPQRVVNGAQIQIQAGHQPALGGRDVYYAGFDPTAPWGVFRTGFLDGGPGGLLLPLGFAVAASGTTGDWAAFRFGALGGAELVVNGGPPPFTGLGDFASDLLSVHHTSAYPRVAYVTLDPDDPSTWRLEVSGTPYVASDVEPFSFGGVPSDLAVNGGGELVFVHERTWWADGDTVERVACRNWYDSPAFELGRPLLGRRGLDGRGRIALIARSPLDDEWVVRLDPIELGNRLENGGFSDGGQLRGWGDDFGGFPAVGADWDPLDAGDDPDSGSVRLVDPAAPGGGEEGGAKARQCVPVAPGRFTFGASLLVPGGGNGAGAARASWTWLSGDDCSGAALGGTTLPAPGTAGVWQRVDATGAVPPGTGSGLVALEAVGSGGAAFTAHFDDVLLVPEPSAAPLAALTGLVAVGAARRRRAGRRGLSDS